MRLLNVDNLRLFEFTDDRIPPYGIFSHRWRNDEISHQDLLQGRGQNSRGLRKITELCKMVRNRKIHLRRSDYGGLRSSEPPLENLEWLWVDTVCIDKSSSAELSEAINSMFGWYSKARECYIYLHDVPSQVSSPEATESAFRHSEWFTRGWTLQELITPGIKVFFNKIWEVCGYIYVPKEETMLHPLFSQFEMLKPPGDVRNPECSGLEAALFERLYGTDRAHCVHHATDIQIEYLNGTSCLSSASIARRMSWAAKRNTTRIEDGAYCLMGLFDINMPLLYGEGDRAFYRLQEEIIKRSNDRSIFAWRDPGGLVGEHGTGLLTTNVRNFNGCGDVPRLDTRSDHPYSITNIGLHIRARAFQCGSSSDEIAGLRSRILRYVLFDSHTFNDRLSSPVHDNPSDPPVSNAIEPKVPQSVGCLGPPYGLFMMQCLHNESRNWYRSSINTPFLSGYWPQYWPLPFVNWTDLGTVEIYAKTTSNIYHGGCWECLQLDLPLFDAAKTYYDKLLQQGKIADKEPRS